MAVIRKARRSIDRSGPGRSSWAALWAALFLLGVQQAAGQEKPDKPQAAEQAGAAAAPDGQLIRVPLPITGNIDNRIKSMVQRAQARMKKRGGERPVIVLEFAPSDESSGEGSDFTRALALARFLSDRQLAGVKTVAFVPESIQGHAVLVALACEWIVMKSDAELGAAGIDEPAEEPLDPTVASGYTQIASRRGTIPVPLALGMVDRRLEVLKVETDKSAEYVLREDLDELKERATVLSEEVLVRPGDLGRFSGRQLRELGFVTYLADDRAALAKALNLEPRSLREDPSLVGGWHPVQFRLEGPVTSSQVARLQRMITDELRNSDVNFILLRIESGGGSVAESVQLASTLAKLPPTVRTVAYVPTEARGDAALVALACDQLVMQNDATLGGEPVEPIAITEIAPTRKVIREFLAPAKGRSWSLPAALIDPELPVHRYRHNKTGAVDYFSAEELKERDDAEHWVRGEPVTRPGEVLELRGPLARKYGLAWESVEGFAELKQLYGLENEPRLVEPNWANYLIQALARPELAIILLMIGGVALYAELQMPGIGIGGFIAAVCFVIFFWSKFLDGTAGWLEVLLFATGVVCLLMEIFVLPGFGVLGLGGGLLVIVSLVLASQTFVLPRDPSQLDDLQNSLLVVGGAMLGILVAGSLLRHYLPRTSYFNRLMLQPPEGEEAAEISNREALVDFQYLLGQQGVATTPLVPSGKARFGDELVNVISNGEMIERGDEIVVSQVHGNRVIVQRFERQSL